MEAFSRCEIGFMDHVDELSENTHTTRRILLIMVFSGISYDGTVDLIHIFVASNILLVHPSHLFIIALNNNTHLQPFVHLHRTVYNIRNIIHIYTCGLYIIPFYIYT